MSGKKKSAEYLAFLRGINVGGHHKVPMAELRVQMEKLKFENVVTILNTGNIIFATNADEIKKLENKISTHLEKAFGFPIPTILRKVSMISGLLSNDPFKQIKLTNDIRFYVSFLSKDTETELSLPWVSDDSSYQILDIIDNNTIVSVLDLSKSRTPKAMKALEQFFGKEITTRNWNTIKRIGKKLESSK